MKIVLVVLVLRAQSQNNCNESCKLTLLKTLHLALEILIKICIILCFVVWAMDLMLHICFGQKIFKTFSKKLQKLHQKFYSNSSKVLRPCI